MNAQPMFNLDAKTTALFESKLQNIDPIAIFKKKGILKATEIFQLSTTVPDGATEYGYTMLDHLGEAKMLAPDATDVPNVDVSGERILHPIGFFGAGMSYNVNDLQAVQLVGADNVIQEKREAVALTVAQKHNQLFWRGDSQYGIVGVLSDANIPNAAVASTGTGSSPLWSTKTGQLILDDLNEAIQAVRVATLGIEEPNLLVLDAGSYHTFQTKRIADGTDETVMTAFLKQHGNFRIEMADEIKGTFTGGVNGFLLGTNNPSVIKLVAPYVYREEPFQRRGLGYYVPAHAKNGGAEIRYPKAFVKRYGI